MFEFEKKLLFYPEKVKSIINKDYGNTLSTVLLYMNSGICNHDCIYCDKNFYEIEKRSFSKEYLGSLLNDMVAMKANSLIILGEGGEPILDRNLSWFIQEAYANKIVCGLYTNGSFISDKIITAFNKLNFIRISLDAGTSKTHRKIHNYPEGRPDFDNAIELMREIDKDKVSVGAAYIVLDDNINEIFKTWQLLNDIGISYLELKIPLRENYQFGEFSKRTSDELKKQIELIGCNVNPKTKLVYNNHLALYINGNVDTCDLTRMESEKCYTCAFRTIVSPLGYFLCSPKKNLPKYRYGDPYTQSLFETWNSERRRSMDETLCDTRCTYYKQNHLISQLINKEKTMCADNCTDEDAQKYFL